MPGRPLVQRWGLHPRQQETFSLEPGCLRDETEGRVCSLAPWGLSSHLLFVTLRPVVLGIWLRNY